MGNTRNPTWSFSEIELLKEKMELLSVAELQSLFPDRSEKAIRRKIEKLREKGEIGYRTKMRKNPAKKTDWNDSWNDKDWGDGW